MSAQETANKLGKNISQIYKFMRRHNLPRRTSAQTNRIRFYKSPLSYSKKHPLSPSEKSLLNSSLMLYWAEGYKAQPAVDFANSNPKMVKIFLMCLRDIYQVNEQRIKIFLYCYSNQNLDTLIEFWSNSVDTHAPSLRLSGVALGNRIQASLGQNPGFVDTGRIYE